MTNSKTVSLGQSRVPDGMRVYAIGDIHGCLDELNRLLTLIDADLNDRPTKAHRIILIGDFVDRGPDSKGVIDLLIHLNKTNMNITFLKGNHEEKLITAFTDMDHHAFGGFSKYGGLDTLASYGITSQYVHEILGNSPGKTEFKRFCDHVRDSVGKDHIDFLNSLDISAVEGDYFFCHAGVDPRAGLETQNSHDLVWMREPFLSWSKPLEKVVVHGHTPRRLPELMLNRINIDTSCVYGNQLTAVVLEGKENRFLSVSSGFCFAGA